MENLIKSFTKEMERYAREYSEEYGVAEIDYQHRRIVEEAATSYVSGIYMATLWGFGKEAADEIAEIAEDYDFVKGYTITGIVTF